MKLVILALSIAVVSCCSPKPPDKPKFGLRCTGPTEASTTIANGAKAPRMRLCKGDVIFEDNFNELNEDIWKHEETLYGGPNNEFQWSTKDRSNSFTWDGFLYINPTLTDKSVPITSGTIDLGNKCTAPTLISDGCKRTGSIAAVLNPIKSAAIKTSNSFSFKYGTLEIRAKIPTGDWLKPSIWLPPKDGTHGIAVVESRGNKHLTDAAGKNYGTNLITSTLYYSTTNPPPAFKKESDYGFDDGLHTYKITWTPTNIEFSVDGVTYPTAGGGGGGGGGGGHVFDKECYILLNLGVGGKNFGPAGITLANPLPWTDTEASPATSFWNDKSNWLPTWEIDDSRKTSSMVIDYVKVTAS